MRVENTAADVLSLDGTWTAELAGQRREVAVPGVWELHGFPLEATGPAIYTCAVDVPASWSGARVMLQCDAVSYYVELFVNDQPVGTHEGLWDPFEVDVTAALRPGAANTIALHITKPGRDGDRFPYRDVIVGFIPYISLPFGGPWGSIRLVAHRAPAWRDLQVAPSIDGTVRVRAQIDPHSRPLAGLTMRAAIAAPDGQTVAEAEQPAVDQLDLALSVAAPTLWAPAQPALYRLTFSLHDGDALLAQAERPFGFRQLSASGDQLLFNGAPVHLRGILSWGWDETTLAPMPSEAQIRAEFARVRALGFNLIKLCLFVPPDRLFQIADEEGMFLWLELPLWYQRLGDHLRRQAQVEYARILQTVHHHPSIILYSLGCELGAAMADAPLLEALNRLARANTCGALICDNSGSGEAYEGLSFDYADFTDYHFYCDLHYFRPMLDHFRRDWRPPRPWIFGEFCDCDDFRDTRALTGDQRPWWRDLLGVDGSLERWAYAVQEERLAAADLPFTPAELEAIARRGSLLVRKTIVEWVRSRAGMGGYVITGLRDTPITTSGIFDDAGRPKYDAATFTAFNAENVLILEQGRARAWRHGGDRPAPVDRFNHFAGAVVDFRIVLAHTAPIAANRLRWSLCDQAGIVLADGESATPALAAEASPRELAAISFALPETDCAQIVTLRVELPGVAVNHWPLYVYPQPQWPVALALYDPAGCLSQLDALPAERIADVGEAAGRPLIAGLIDDAVLAYIRTGGSAIALQTGAGRLPTVGLPFWRESIKLLYPHPLLSGFPHHGSADLQFYALATDHAIDSRQLAAALPGLRSLAPVIGRLDARLFTVTDYLIDLAIGQGRLIASTLRFGGGAGDQPVGLSASPAAQHLLNAMVAALGSTGRSI